MFKDFYTVIVCNRLLRSEIEDKYFKVNPRSKHIETDKNIMFIRNVYSGQ